MLNGICRGSLKMAVLIAISILITLLLYYGLSQRDDSSISPQASERCVTDLDSMKSYLNIVTTYKDKLEVDLTNAQHQMKNEQLMIQSLLNDYATTRKHLTLCEVQSKDIEEEYNHLKSRMKLIEVSLANCTHSNG